MKLRRDEPAVSKMSAARLMLAVSPQEVGMNVRKHSLPLLVATLFLAALSLAVPSTARAMFACNPLGCDYYFEGGGSVNGVCLPFSDHCHCFVEQTEMNQHQTGCNLPGGGG